MISSLISRLTILLTASLSMVILNIGIALFLGERFGKSYYGFFLLAVFYGIIGLVIYRHRKTWIKIPLNNWIISHELKQQ